MIKKCLIKLLRNFPLIGRIIKSRKTAAPIRIRDLFIQKILGYNRRAYWPAHHSSRISDPDNIQIGIGTAPGLSNGCYIQGMGGIEIGDYTIVAPGVGIISGNHDLFDYRKHDLAKVKIGHYCWIGMNVVILPGVVLGDHTIVAAGAVVNKKFAEGYCVLGGSPAKIIKNLDPKECIKYKNEYEYYGYLTPKQYKKKFQK